MFQDWKQLFEFEMTILYKILPHKSNIVIGFIGYYNQILQVHPRACLH